MAPVCVRVAFIGGGQGEPSRWAGPHGAHRAARRASGIVANQNEKNCAGGHEGIRIGPPAGRVGRGRASMADTQRAGARRRFRNRRFRYVTRAAGRGRRCPNGGNLEGTDNRKEPKQNPGNRMISTVSGAPIRAEDTRFELARGRNHANADTPGLTAGFKPFLGSREKVSKGHFRRFGSD